MRGEDKVKLTELGRSTVLAKEHAELFVLTISPMIQKTFEEAFKHGYKHGVKDTKGGEK